MRCMSIQMKRHIPSYYCIFIIVLMTLITYHLVLKNTGAINSSKTDTRTMKNFFDKFISRLDHKAHVNNEAKMKMSKTMTEQSQPATSPPARPAKHKEEFREVNVSAILESNLTKYDNTHLLNYIRSKMHPPSTEPYNLHDRTNLKDPYNQYLSCCTYPAAQRLIKHYFKNKRNGFFIEAGALDGEFLSNTLNYLERDQNWTGLLVEPGKFMFQEVLKKQRKAWKMNCCLGTKPYPHKAVIAALSPSLQNLILSGQSVMMEAYSAKDRLPNGRGTKFETVQCYPLASLLLALDITHVDFFSFDVEDVETYIIDNFPFDRITVDVWFIEHRNQNVSLWNPKAGLLDMDFVKRFTSRGYDWYRYADYVFIRQGSEYSKMGRMK